MLREGYCIKSRYTDNLKSFEEKYGSQFGQVIHINNSEVEIFTNRKIILTRKQFDEDWIID